MNVWKSRSKQKAVSYTWKKWAEYWKYLTESFLWAVRYRAPDPGQPNIPLFAFFDLFRVSFLHSPSPIVIDGKSFHNLDILTQIRANHFFKCARTREVGVIGWWTGECGNLFLEPSKPISVKRNLHLLYRDPRIVYLLCQWSKEYVCAYDLAVAIFAERLTQVFKGTDSVLYSSLPCYFNLAY